MLSANVHNYLAEATEAQVVLELDGTSVTNPDASPLAASESLTQTVNIPAGGEVRVDWRVNVADEGNAIVRMKALTNVESDAMQMSFPCYVHGMLKQEAWAGTVRPDQQSALVTVTVPEQRRAEQTVLEVRYSPSLAGAMVDALPYLADYPYGCTEQTLNRFLPAAITQKTLLKMNLDRSYESGCKSATLSGDSWLNSYVASTPWNQNVGKSKPHGLPHYKTNNAFETAV